MPLRWTPVEVTILAPPLSFFRWKDPAKVVTGVDLALGYAHSRRVYGISAGVAATIDDDAVGVIAHVLYNRVGGNARAIMGGAYNRVDGEFRGVQLGIFKNVVTGPVGGGLQIAVLKNEVLADFYGIQVSPFINEASGFEYRGIQASIFGNWSEAESYRGIQAGGFNAAWGRLAGLQVGVVNYIGDSDKRDAVPYPLDARFSGIQIGVINVGGHVHGVQLGLINIARSLAGAQFGVLNFSRHGGLPFMLGVNAGAST